MKALVLTLYFDSGMSEPIIRALLTQAGVKISSGQISNLLIANQDRFHQERKAILAAGLQSSPWQHIDTTSTRVDGANQQCHVLCNPLYTVYTTLPQRDRLHVLDVQPPDGSEPADNYGKIREEIQQYSPLLAEKQELIALNKLDLLPDESERQEAVEDLRARLRLGHSDKMVAISGGGRLSLRELLEQLWGMLHPNPADKPEGWKRVESPST